MFSTKFLDSIKMHAVATYNCSPKPVSELGSTAFTSPLQKMGRKHENEETTQ